METLTKRKQEQVKKYAPQWTQYANIKFTFVDSGAVDILVAFNPSEGSWSYLGTDSSYYSSRNKASMNLGWIDSNKKEADIRSVILHQFGHALGAVHKHESPYANIPWNKDQVYKDLGGPPNNWDRATVDHNMFTLYTLQDTQGTAFDPESIMLYHSPASWTTNGKGTNYNTDLSAPDMAYAKFAYPADDYDAGQFNILEIRPGNKPQLVNEMVKLYYKKYKSVPKLPVGITALDISCTTDIRINATTSEATTESFKASLNAWGDTILFWASMTYLEKSSAFDYIQTGVYNTQETRPWNDPQLTQSKRINFAKPFSAPPKVVTWLQALNMNKDKHWRIRVYATDIDSNGFTVHADTWGDSILYSAGVTWLAYPADRPGVTSGNFDTQEVRPWNKPQLENSGFKSFGGTTFSKVPKVIMALDFLDYDHSRNLRVRASTSSVTKYGLTWYLSSWHDSIMYTTGASFFAWT